MRRVPGEGYVKLPGFVSFASCLGCLHANVMLFVPRCANISLLAASDTRWLWRCSWRQRIVLLFRSAVVAEERHLKAVLRESRFSAWAEACW